MHRPDLDQLSVFMKDSTQRDLFPVQLKELPVTP